MSNEQCEYLLYNLQFVAVTVETINGECSNKCMEASEKYCKIMLF